ncbi:1-deoxy-D-xylulose-5-phosphate reductoisomerase [Halalkalibacterium halodurans]|uniref:1-deoxy-D-xylulose-5-phosphate reductoisomerase n=1 Tax=Halalkalibacterium halodurans TaxID=86665 RepID=UPI002AA9E6BD|nr:1-deoxy-D-xylulose-5-phosphate reductoisomerase [Halalkalibacterium halodurans]MDY7222969.1 1-deoxy-D-xylulose-5-phosphate reductoisomerase [Halalkalibacterium halodurans]MDY7242190.1 1-deoxy-D-xylulose-5-phosphate reductoisomerase [Halalkalibacterium halodurans]
MKGISVLGATGSIGTQTLDVLANHRDKFRLVAMSVGKNLALAEEQIHQFKPPLVSVMTDEDRKTLASKVPEGTRVVCGEEGLIEVATAEKAEILVNAVIGSVGLAPTLAAIEAKKTIALANKETLVTAGHLVTEKAREHGVKLLPVDSEHSAIFQALQGERMDRLHRIIITASGGSFRDKSRDELNGVTVEDALKHPNWSMGAKITIDSATMMNKGLEVIEAHWLFNLPYEKIDVLLHKESIIHSMVEFVDRSVIAQLGTPDMRVPIQYALSYPDRLEFHEGQQLNLWEVGKLHFAPLDMERFRCMAFAYESGKQGGTMPTVLNAANEEAVGLFLNNQLSFLGIEDVIEKALERHERIDSPSLADILHVDQETRAFVHSLIK